MSLVLEALRRVEKPDARAGSIGATVTSYRPARKRPGRALPLLLGLGAGGLIVVFFGPQARDPGPVSLAAADEPSSMAPPQSRPKGRAGLPPPLSPPIAADPRAPEPPALASMAPRRREPAASPAAAAPALVLQAISERDSQPIAIINDQLVRVGDLVGAARVVSIGSDTVDVLLANGLRDIVRFAPAPEPAPTPSPLPGPISS